MPKPLSDEESADLQPDAPPGRFRRLATAIWRAHIVMVLVTIGVVLFLVVLMAPDLFVTVRSGEVGVLYKRFDGGTQVDRLYGEGLTMVAPWDELFIYSTRIQEQKHEMPVLTSEALTITIRLSIRYHPEREFVGLLHQQVGPDYKEKIVIPEVEAALRTVMAQFTMDDVHGAQRGVVQRVINDSLEEVSQNFVRIDDVVLRQVELPESIRANVEEKMAHQERAASYPYRLLAETQEAERRLIEAGGLKQANDLLNSSLTPNVLAWKGLEVTSELARSGNAKTIVIGNGPNALPLILPGGGQ